MPLDYTAGQTRDEWCCDTPPRATFGLPESWPAKVVSCRPITVAAREQ